MCAGCSAAGGFYFLARGEGRRHLRATAAHFPGASAAMKGNLVLLGQTAWARAVLVSIGECACSDRLREGPLLSLSLSLVPGRGSCVAVAPE